MANVWPCVPPVRPRGRVAVPARGPFVRTGDAAALFGGLLRDQDLALAGMVGRAHHAFLLHPLHQ